MCEDLLLWVGTPLFISLAAVVVFWDLIWRGFALWRSARNEQPIWFVLLLVLNTAGILPIIYLLTHRRRY